MLYMYVGSLLYRWGWGIKSKMAKAPAKDKSVLKVASYFIQNYSASIQATTWWMRQASLGTQLINIALVNSHCVVWSLMWRWHARVLNIQYHEQSPRLQPDHSLQIRATHIHLCRKMQGHWFYDTYRKQLRNYKRHWIAMPLWTFRKGYYLPESWFNDNTNHTNPSIWFFNWLWHNTSIQLTHINVHYLNKFPTDYITEYKGLPYIFE